VTVARPEVGRLLIVGAGPVGLSAGILAGRLGIPTVIVERHPGTAIHPKARGITIRTMELFRQWGVEDEVRAVGVPRETRNGVTFAKTLSDPDYRWVRVEDAETTGLFSPTVGAGCPQDRLELVLLEAARSLPSLEIRFGTEVQDLLDHGDSVTATVRDVESGEVSTIESDYVIGADGGRSTTRDLIGATMDGPNALNSNINIHFDADLRGLVEDHPSRLYWIDNPPHVTGVFATLDGNREWLLNVVSDDVDSFTEEHCIDLVRHAAGILDLDVRIIDVLRWNAAAQVASSWRSGRVFLVGDAAHLMPPYGGFGANTGVQDAHNLVWKLSACLGGWGGEGLLASYEAERHPVAAWTIEQSRERMKTLVKAQPNVSDEVLQSQVAERVDGVVFGYAYDTSSVVVPDGSAPPVVADPAGDYVPVGRPGHRAPHVPLRRGDDRISTIDLFDDSYVLLSLGESAWQEAFDLTARDRDVPLAIVEVGSDVEDTDGVFAARYGLDVGGAVLVRPDGYVAWRSATSPPPDAKDQAMSVLEVVTGNGGS